MAQQTPPRGNAAVAQMFGIPHTTPEAGDVRMSDYRPNSLTQPFRFREFLASGEYIISTFMGMNSPEVAKVLAAGGYHCVFLDAEHTPMGPERMRELVQTVNHYSEGTTTSIVRVPTHGHEWVAWALDAGAGGVVFPHSETAEEARHAVDSARFPPEGKRSYPPVAVLPGLTDGLPAGKKSMLEVWNNNAAVLMQIESRLGAENAEEILSVPGVDGCMIGSGDLRLDLGLQGLSGNEPEYTQAIDKILAAAHKYNKPVFGFAMGPLLEMRLAEGYKGLFVSGDLFSLLSGQAAAVAAAHASIKKLKQGENTPN